MPTGLIPTAGYLTTLREVPTYGNSAIVSTSTLIRAGQYEDTLRIADVLLGHPHDLIHKAVGWMLREVGKKDIALLRRYLSDRYSRMPRTALRYAIERMDSSERREWLSR